MAIADWWQAGLRFLFQTPCPLCHRSTAAVLCQDCTQQLQACELPDPAQNWHGQLPLLAWGSYQGPMKRAIAALKYQQQSQVAEPLGFGLGQVWLRHQPQILRRSQRVVVVPIPLHCDRKQQRGFNQAELIAEAFCRVTGFGLNTALLTRQRATAPQFTLSARERQANLAQAFRVDAGIARKLSGAQILLLDDIYTTGATVQEASQALQAASALVLGVVTAALTAMPNSRGNK